MDVNNTWKVAVIFADCKLLIFCSYDFDLLVLGYELLEELLTYDDIFLDFFNAFLALPVSRIHYFACCYLGLEYCFWSEGHT